MISRQKLGKKLTVSIGIPAHNEAGNLANLLRSILVQKRKGYVLQKVWVICDGCSDETEEVAIGFARKHNEIVVINDGKRLGKCARLNQIYELNKSDLLLSLDGDVVMADKLTMGRMVELFGDPKTLVVAANQQPILRAKSWMAKVLFTNHLLWNHTREKFRDGDHISNLYGAASMLQGEFAKTIRYPEKITADEEYLYAMAKERNGFRYARQAVVWYVPMATLFEYRMQASRFLTERYGIMGELGKKIMEYHRIPVRYKLEAIAEMMLISPVNTTLAVLMNLWVRQFPYEDKLNKKGMWTQAKTTKLGVRVEA